MYGTTRAATRKDSTGQHLARLFDSLANFGVPLPAQAEKAQEAWQGVTNHIRAVRESAQTGNELEQIASRLANGEGTFLDVLTAASASTIKDSPTVLRVYDAATHKASAAFARNLEPIDWVGHYQPYAKADVATITAAIPAGYTVDDSEHAPRGQTAWLMTQPPVSEAWNRLTLIYTTTRVLRSYKITPSTLQRDDHYEWRGEATAIIQRSGDGYEYSARERMNDKDLDTFVWATRLGLIAGLYRDADDTSDTLEADSNHDSKQLQNNEPEHDAEEHERKASPRKQHPGEHKEAVA